jgi:hypothetical protein
VSNSLFPKKGQEKSVAQLCVSLSCETVDSFITNWRENNSRKELHHKQNNSEGKIRKTEFAVTAVLTVKELGLNLFN